MIQRLRYFFFILFLINGLNLHSQISFPTASAYTYLKFSEAQSIGSNWMNPDFDDSSWSTGEAPFRYGDGVGGTLISDMQNNYSGIYLRSHFTASNTDNLLHLNLNVNYDDGFIIWLNGEELLKMNAPAIPSSTAFAPANHESGNFESFSIPIDAGMILEGENTLAIQSFNISLTSTDFLFDMSLSALVDQPEFADSLGIVLSHASGFYDSPFQLTLNHALPGIKILYTLDGSNPQTSPNVIEMNPGESLLIDPSSSSRRALTPAITLRASVYHEGFNPSKPVSATYIFLDKVKTQNYPGGGWPSNNINNQIIDLAIDTRVITSTSYINQIDAAFKDIPSISVITDLGNLFDAQSGIYVNALNHGIAWEKDCSVELIYPDNTEGFKVNAGLRIRGGFSRNDGFAKHSFRLLFKEIYGDSKLRYPLFGEEGSDRFDNIDLRTAQNYSWANGGPNNTMIREVFARDTQGAMQQAYTRSRYYHLYLNGMYWGIYMTQERSEASFASDYLGGEEEDYDVIKVATENGIYDIEATDGITDDWRKIYTAIESGMTSNENYFALLGKDAEGKAVKNGEKLIEIDNLIDYMLIVFYTGSFDAPVSSFLGNTQPNNFYAINNRNYKAEGFRFFAHDMEHGMFAEAHSPGIGINENRVNLASLTSNPMRVSSFRNFHPQWLHYRLSANAEYRQAFIDRAWLHLSEGGVLSEDKCLERIEKRIAEIETAIIAESARWGDTHNSVNNSFTKNDHWIPELNKLRNNFVPYRNIILENQLRDANLFTKITPPQIKSNSKKILANSMELGDYKTIQLYNPNPSVDMYYNLNGDDPRMVGGGISPSAIKTNENDIQLSISQTTFIKARCYSNGNWSALKELSLLKSNEDYAHLKITEIYYHPIEDILGSDTLSGKSLEFIELKNTGESALNLSGLKLDSAIYYTIPDNTILEAGNFYVIASKPTSFYDNYGIAPNGNYKGFLENSGEKIVLTNNKGEVIVDMSYAAEYPWPTSASGTGRSLVSTISNPTGNPANAWYWTSSVNIEGSPFSDEPGLNNSITEQQSIPQINLFPNPGKDYLNIKVNSPDNDFSMQVAIYSLSGKLFYTTHAGKSLRISISATGIESGIYIVKIIGKDFSSSLKYVYQK